MEYRTTRRNFIRQCSYSAIVFAAPQCMSAPMSEFDLQTYTMEHYMRDVQSVGLHATWNQICSSFDQCGEPESGLFKFHNVPYLYQQGCECVGRKVRTLDIEGQVSKVATSYLKRCSGDGLCGVNCGTGLQLLDYLSTLSYDEVKRITTKGLLHLYDTDQLAMRICATVIAVRYKLYGIRGVEQTWIRPGQKITLPKGLRTFVCDTEDGISSVSNLLDKVSSAVVLTSRPVEVESMKENYPAEIENWIGSVMTFGSSGEDRLALVVIESKSHKEEFRHDIA